MSETNTNDTETGADKALDTASGSAFDKLSLEWEAEISECNRKLDVLNKAADEIEPDKRLDELINPLSMKCIAFQRCLIGLKQAILDSKNSEIDHSEHND